MFIGAGTTINAGINVAVPLPAPSSVITSSSSVNEGSTITFTSTSTGVPDGTLYWTRYGGAANDADFSAVNGSFIVTDGVGTFTVTPVADHLTEGTELFSVVVRTGSITGPIIGTSAGKEILDTSLDPTYALATAGSVSSVNEGAEITFNVTTTNVDDGTILYWDVGVSGGNMIFARLSTTSGSVTITGGAASFSITVSADNLTSPDQQYFALSLYKDAPNGYGVQVGSIRIDVNDTSQTPPVHGSAVINQPQNDYLKISGPGTGIVKIGPDSNGQNYAGGSTIFSIPFFADGVVETIPIFGGGGWTITFKNGQTRTITSVATGYNGAITYSLNLNSPLYAGANEVFPAVIKSSDFVDRPWNLGTTWTVEFWIYMNSGSSGAANQQGGIWGVLNQGGWATKDSINIALSGGYLQINQGNNSSYYNKYVTEPTPLQWVHVAVVNNAGTNKVYYNGIEQVPLPGPDSKDYTASWTNSTKPLFIGCLGRDDNDDTGGGSFDGKITNLRITNTAVYAANFYPPTTLPTKIAGTKLLWNPTDQAFTTDASDSASTITNNGASYSSSYPAVNNTRGSALFGSSSYMRVGNAITAPTTADSGNSGGLPNPPSPDGTGTFTRVNLVKYPDISAGMTFVYDNITFTVAQVVPQENHFYDDLGLVTFYPRYNGTIPSGTNLTFIPSQPFALGTTWTIEWWSKATSATVYHGAGLYTVMSAGAGNNLIDIYYQDGLLHAGNYVEICAEPPAGVWTHVAMVTTGGSTQVYYNGIAQTVNSVNYNLTDTNHLLYIGCRGSNLFQNFVGELTDIRITNTAVYTTDFVPDQPITSIAGHTKLLYTPTVDTIYGVDTGDYSLPMKNKSVVYNSDYPVPIIDGTTITATVAGDTGTYQVYYTNIGAPIGSIAVKDAPTLGSISIVGTSLFYIAPCYQGTFDVFKGYDHAGSEIDNFSLYFKGLGNPRTVVPVSITITAT